METGSAPCLAVEFGSSTGSVKLPPVQRVPRFSPRVTRAGRGASHSPPSSAEVAKGLELYLRLSPVPAQACHGVTFHWLC